MNVNRTSSGPASGPLKPALGDANQARPERFDFSPLSLSNLPVDRVPASTSALGRNFAQAADRSELSWAARVRTLLQIQSSDERIERMRKH